MGTLGRRIPRGLLILSIACATVLAATEPARANCHIAAFDSASESVTVNENAGHVTLTVELQGGDPSCEGTVDYETVNGTAVAGQDYTAKQGTLTFASGDDREASFNVSITNDTADEPSQQFTVTLSNPTGGITEVDPTPATVTITDNDPAPQPTSKPSKPKASSSASPTRRASASASPSTSRKPSASPSPSASRSKTPSPTITAPTLSPTPTGPSAPAPNDDQDGGNAALFIAILVTVAALAVGAIYLSRRRAAK